MGSCLNMHKSELISIKESIERIEKFPVGYPRLITDVEEKWLPYFKWAYELCVSRAKAISGDNLPEGQMKML